MRPDLDLVIFDCDGVLVDSEPIALRVNSDMIAELGWHLTDEDIVARFVGRSMAENVAQIEAHIGHAVPTGWVDRFTSRIRAAHDAELTAVDGIGDALDTITGWRLPICVASSGSQDKIRHSLTRHGLTQSLTRYGLSHSVARHATTAPGETGPTMYDRFDGHIFSATEVARGKPAPDLFLHAARAMGADPARCAVVEDSHYGVLAARAAGMRALGYAGGVTPAGWLEGPNTTVFTDMRELPTLLQDLG